MSRVDVVIPCYNYGHFLRDCVESVLSPQAVDVRVLIVDDASTDNTQAIGESLASSDPRVTFRRHEANIGHIATYNEGLLEWANADYSLLLSADDVLAPQALARAADVLDRHPDVGMVYGMGVLFSGAVPPAEEITGKPEYVVIPGVTFVQRCFEYVNPLETPTAVVRTSLQHKLGGYRKELPHTGDVEMWMRFAVHAPVAVLRSVQAFVRRHEGNMSGGYYRERLRDCLQVIAAGDTIVREWGQRLPDAEKWRHAMGVRVSIDACWYASRAFDSGDFEAYRSALSFAQRANPNVRRLAVWWKVKARGLVGPTLWISLRPLWAQMARQGDQRERAPDTANSAHLSGWWPTAS